MISRKRAAAMACLVALGLAAAASPGCSNQGEGERCDVRAENAGNEDCQSGLRCTPRSELNNQQSDLCCPADRSQSTVAVCAVAPNPGGSDAAPPAEASIVDTGVDTGAVVDTGVVDSGVTDTGADVAEPINDAAADADGA